MDFKELCASRFSTRDFKDEAIPEEKLRYIEECVRLAPSACNKQPWEFIVVKSPEALELVRGCYNREWFAKASLYVIACCRTDEAWVRPWDGKNHGDIDVAIAIEHLCLAAASVGLGTCWVCNFNVCGCVSAFDLPDELVPVALIPIGVPASEPTPKKRKELGEIWREV